MDSCGFRRPPRPEGNAEKTYFVHIAASLRHGELYGKKPYDFPSEPAGGSVRSRAHVDILGSHSSMAQLSETIYHRESNTHRAAKSTIDPLNLRDRRIPVCFIAACTSAIDGEKCHGLIWLSIAGV